MQVWVDLVQGALVALEDVLNANIRCLGCGILQVNECCSL